MVFIQMVPVPLVTKCATLYMYVLIRVMANPRYICSLTILSTLSLSSHPYPFPSLSITSFPISLSIHFHFPHFPILPQSFPHIPTLSPSPFFLSPTPSFPPSIHHTTAYNPYTPTLHPLPHVSSYPPTHAFVSTLYALVSTFSRSLTLSSHIHPSMFHVKHNNNNSYFHFSILYIIYHIILYTYPLHIGKHLCTIIHHEL